ncbi:hypothetical protein SNEBB_004224 [Seison nebaliae]|nr:hypothetical protein SNEBB_004224 [Seison nebaliae]
MTRRVFAASIPYILQSQHTSFSSQAIFSFVFWPFSLKLLWAPIIDGIYWKKFGRRKSWLIPVQYAIGFTFLILSRIITKYLNAENEMNSSPNIKILTMFFILLTFGAATQDIVVDGWALTMLSRENVGWASTCNSVGQTAGYFIGNVLFLALESVSFSNNYVRPFFNLPSSSQGILTLSSFMYYCGLLFLISTTLIAMIKQEKNDERELMTIENQSIWGLYKILWEICKLPSMTKFIIFLLTVKIGFAATDALTGLELIELGVPKEKLALFAVVLTPIQILLPFCISRYTANERPMRIYSMAIAGRLFMGIVIILMIYSVPMWRVDISTNDDIIMNLNSTNSTNSEKFDYPFSFYGYLISIFAVHQVFLYIMFVCHMAFFAKVSDSSIGGTNMTLLNTISNLGGSLWSTISLYLIEMMQIDECEIDRMESTLCLFPLQRRQCEMMGGKCKKWMDGYFVLTFICTMIGSVWLIGWGRRTIEILDRKALHHWTINHTISMENDDKKFDFLFDQQNMRILVVGDVKNQFNFLFKKVRRLMKKNSFDLLFCVGESYNEKESSLSQLIEQLQSEEAPLMTYIIALSSQSIHHNMEIADNIILLTNNGILKCASGLIVAYLDGLEHKSQYDIEQIRKLEEDSSIYNSIHLLLTTDWPRYIDNGTTIDESINLDFVEEKGSDLIARLLINLSPQYHFVSGRNVYWERIPFFSANDERTSNVYTRFISLASLNNEEKRKAIYAFTINLEEKQLNISSNCPTPNPFDINRVMRCNKTFELLTSNETISNDQYFFDSTQTTKEEKTKEKEEIQMIRKNYEPLISHSKRKADHSDSQQNCWFCLSSPMVEKHLIFHLGISIYMALAKGQLCEEHWLLMPIKHLSSSAFSEQEIIDELECTKLKLINYYNKTHHCIFFERSLKSYHFQVQFVPVVKCPELTEDEIEKRILKICRDKFEVDLQPLTVTTTFANYMSEYYESQREFVLQTKRRDDIDHETFFSKFYFHLQINGKKHLMINLHWKNEMNKNFPLQLGRIICCDLLKIDEKKSDWKSCIQDEEDEKNLTKSAKLLMRNIVQKSKE